MAERPEYVQCIRHTDAEHPHESWCGRTLWRHDLAFESIDHAVYNAQQEGRLLACSSCVGRIMATFRTEELGGT